MNKTQTASMPDCPSAGQRHGFTLIELSIVLVIIGLVIGGILVGRSLIRGAEIRAMVSEMEKLNAALTTFKLKYNALAGDMADASSLGLGTGCETFLSSGNGNGDGMLSYSTAAGAYREDKKLFCHMYNASLWPSSNGVGGPISYSSGNGYTSYCWTSTCNTIPSIASTSVFIAVVGNWNGIVSSYGPANGFYFYYSTTVNTGNPIGGTPFTPIDAYAVDVKTDDALPTTGKVQAWGSPNPTSPTTGAAGSANCVSNSVTPNAYNLTYTATTPCTLAFKMAVYQ